MTRESHQSLKRCALITLMIVIASCGMGGGGGGGGSEGENYTGYTDFQLENDSLDSGDLSRVTLTVYDVNKNGIILKFFYPKSLKFQSGSALKYSGDDTSWSPTIPYTESTTSEGRYLVFFLSPPSADETNRVAVSFNVKAMSTDPSAFIEVDLDNNDPNVPDSQEFRSADPKFSGIDRWNITIDGQDVATPTPGTGTPAASPTVAATPTKAAS